MFLHSRRSYFKITLCSLLPLIGTNKKKERRYTQQCICLRLECCMSKIPAPAQESWWVLLLTGHIPLHGSRDHPVIRLAKSWWNKSNLCVHWPPLLAGLSTCIFQSCVKPPWKSPHWKKLNQTRAASHVSCSSGGGWPRYSHSRHHFPCSSCSPGLPSLSHNQCTSTPLQCLWIPFHALEDHRYLTSWKLTETHFGVNRELSGSLS